MPQFDFNKPMTFIDALEQFSLALHVVMVALRNEANFHDSGDEGVLVAVELFESILDDTRDETKTLAPKVERRVRGQVN